MDKLSPSDFAKLCVLVQDKREASWDGRRYTKSYDQVAQAEILHPFEAWAPIIAILLFPGYSEVWDWVRAQAS